MFKRILGAGVFGVMCALFGAGVLNTPAHAKGEILSWNTYTSIAGNGGKFGAPKGDSGAISFKQSKNIPNVFIATMEDDDCKGEIKLTLGTDVGVEETDEATLDYDKNTCPKLVGISEKMKVNSAKFIRDKVSFEIDYMTNAYIVKGCGGDESQIGQWSEQATPDNPNPEEPEVDEDKILAECDDDLKEQLKKSAEDTVDACKISFDYINKTYLANGFLDCVSERLGVPRFDATDVPEPEDPEDTSGQCAIADIGFIVCPSMQFLAWITDWSFDLLTPWFDFEPLKEQTGGTGPGTGDTPMYAYWKFFRNFANVMFVLVFVIIILSYVTNFGLSTYNVKKMMPRMVVAVLLVNTSFFLCGIAVDLSNILGGTLKDTLVKIAPPSSNSKEYENWTQVTGAILGAGPADESFTRRGLPECKDQGAADTALSLLAISPDDPTFDINNLPACNPTESQEEAYDNDQTASEADDSTPVAADDENEMQWSLPTRMLMNGILITGAVVLFANLSVLVPALVMSLIAIVTLLVLLIVRQAVLIVLVVISPIALSLYVLPNLKHWAVKWIDGFTKFLIIFPVVSLIFGASYLASRVVMEQANQNGQTLVAILSLGIQVLPLFITPVILKLSGGMLDRFAGVVNNPNKGPFDAMRNGAAAYRKDRKNIRDVRRVGGSRSSGNISDIHGKNAVGTGLKRARALNNRYNPLSALGRANLIKKRGEAGLGSLLDEQKAHAFGSDDGIYDGLNDELTKDLANKDLGAKHSSDRSINMRGIQAATARFMDAGTPADKLFETLAAAAATGQATGNLKGSNKDGSLTDAERAAAAQMAANQATVAEAEGLILQSSQMPDIARRALVDGLRRNAAFKNGAKHFGASAMNDIAEGNIKTQADIDQKMTAAINNNAFGVSTLAQTDVHTLQAIARITSYGPGAANMGPSATAAAYAVTPEARAQLADNIDRARDPSGKVDSGIDGARKAALDEIRRNL